MSSIRKVLTWTTGLTLSGITADYLIVKKYHNVNYCYENAEHDLLGTFSQRNPNEPEICGGVDHYRTVIESSKNESYNINQLANSFFSNPLFRMQTKIERKPLTEQQVDTCNFEIGDQISDFKVIEKNQDEIMMRSNDGFLLWLKLVNEKEKVQLNFGSCMLSDSPVAQLPPPIFYIGLNLHFLYARYLLFFTKKQFNSKFVMNQK